MIEVKNLKTLVNLPNKPQDGEIAYCIDSDTKYRYSKEIDDWIPYKELTRYDYKKNIASQFPGYNDTDNKNFIKFVNIIFADDINNQNTIILMSFADFSTNYLTIFYPTEGVASTLGDMALEVIHSIGDILSSEYNEEVHGIEIWVKDKSNNKIEQLFLVNYEEGVVYI